MELLVKIIMNFKLPKNSDKYQWTQHAIFKLRQYGLSSQRITRVIRAPKRIEKGIVKNTIAVMQPASTRFVRSSTRLDSARLARGGPSSTKKVNGKETWSQEIWAMYQSAGRRTEVKSPKLKVKSDVNPHPTLSQIVRGGQGKIKIISAWRYPGISPKNNPIPQEIFDEIGNIL